MYETHTNIQEVSQIITDNKLMKKKEIWALPD